MPSITTHHFFAKEVFTHLSKNIKEKIKPSYLIYLTFAQSHDFLFYSNKKEIRSLGHNAHHELTQEYLLNIIKIIKENHLEENSEALSYLYGSITHYILDTTCHPYIFYKTGVYRKNEPETYKYKGEHTHIEKDIDAYYYEKYTNKKYNNCNIPKEIISKPIFNKELTKLITKTFEKTYKVQNLGKEYIKAIKYSKLIHLLFINDKYGIKKKVYKILDKISKRKWGYLEGYSTYILNPNIDFLNIEKKEWIHPCNKDIKYNYSFEELFDLSLKNALNIIKRINVYFDDERTDINLEHLIPNLDYSTGLEINNENRLTYFEY